MAFKGRCNCSNTSLVATKTEESKETICMSPVSKKTQGKSDLSIIVATSFRKYFSDIKHYFKNKQHVVVGNLFSGGQRN